MLRTMEGRTDRILFRSAAILLVVAAVIYASYDYLFSGIEWTPLRIPVELVEGRQHTGEFVALWSVVYEIHLDTDRSLDLQQQNCLLGIETVVPERCADIAPELFLSWKVESDGAVIAAGESPGPPIGYWGPSIGKILGAFQAVKGRGYRVTATVARSALQLQQTSPRLQVAVSPRERKWTYVWSGLLIVIAAALLLLAIVLSILLARRSLLQRRR
jgi:hypothetical protein